MTGYASRNPWVKIAPKDISRAGCWATEDDLRVTREPREGEA
jgi:hypothetical protein